MPQGQIPHTAPCLVLHNTAGPGSPTLPGRRDPNDALEHHWEPSLTFPSRQLAWSWCMSSFPKVIVSKGCTLGYDFCFLVGMRKPLGNHLWGRAWPELPPGQWRQEGIVTLPGTAALVGDREAPVHSMQGTAQHGVLSVGSCSE